MRESRTWPRVRVERGASAVEHALLLAGIAAVIVLVVVLLGGQVTSLFKDTCDNVQTERDNTTC